MRRVISTRSCLIYADLGEKRHALSATMGPLVALVSAAMTTPPSYRQPTMVVPVLVAFGRGTPRACRAMFLLWLLKSKPAIVGELRRCGVWRAVPSVFACWDQIKAVCVLTTVDD